ncbi:MAG TPA: AI-2E family transporter, partial [Candidatus Baltobacteraceae bacterium]|nr:AI-2E family transporter [Candidatus Baltobacteraceae bacterium]
MTFALKVLMVVVLAIYVGEFVVDALGRIKGVVYVLIGAIFFSYLIFPIVQWLRRRMPLVLAIVVVYIAIVIGILIAGWFIIPRIAEEGQTLAQRYPEIVHRLQDLINNPNDPITSHLPAFVREELARVPSQVVAWFKEHGVATFGHVLTVLAGVAVVGATFIVIPLITLYLLLDLDNLKLMVSSVIPEQRWRATVRLLGEFDSVIGGFVRGQLLVAVTVGVLITLAMWILHVPYPFLLGLIAAIGDLVPYVGAIVAYLPAALSAVINNGVLNAVFVTVAFIAIYEAEGHLIAPN